MFNTLPVVTFRRRHASTGEPLPEIHSVIFESAADARHYADQISGQSHLILIGVADATTRQRGDANL
jgi:hypothetical protein